MLSMKDRWLLARITGRSSGTFPRPVTVHIERMGRCRVERVERRPTVHDLDLHTLRVTQTDNLTARRFIERRHRGGAVQLRHRVEIRLIVRVEGDRRHPATPPSQDVARRLGIGAAEVDCVVGSRREAAAEVQDLARSRGWPLLELRHELATLEQIFLSRTRGGPAEEEVA